MPDFPPQYDMHQSLGFLINRTGRRLGHALRTVFQENGFDITPAQWGVLCFLANRDGVNQQELAEISSRDKTTLARVIKGMEKRGLIARVPDKADRRQNHLFLTREGAKLRDALVPQLPVSQRSELEERIRAAIDAENYELAAILRDELRILDDRPRA